MRDIIDYFKLVFIFFGALAINGLFLPDYGFHKSDLGFLDGLTLNEYSWNVSIKRPAFIWEDK